ncbi:hypothetical protein CFOL_v3_09282 [Cephalotus follicularis]|uniref:Uncharacterized protein n=1 Tax=Cephalotus follicularis TaxID=3775 RepID=A0A1Q3BCT9_CEPFO|nr:hypothetical protein CFOL_v3_09282 [Cephalotus follicularis]
MSSGAHLTKRIPRIKFPQRLPKPSGTASQPEAASTAGNTDMAFLSSSKVSSTVGGKASLQPKRTPVSKEEIEAILVCKAFFCSCYRDLCLMVNLSPTQYTHSY